MMRALVAMVGLALSISGCGGDQLSDLKQFVKESSEGLRGRVEPIPEVKQFEPFAYNAFDLSDPFKPRRAEPDVRAGVGSGPRPDLNRRKEALESFPLEILTQIVSGPDTI